MRNNFIIKFNICLILLIFTCSCSNSKILKYRNYGIDYLNSGNYQEALNYFNDALKLGNGEVTNLQYDLLMYKAETLFMLKKYDEAKEIYDLLLTIDKNNKTYKELNNKVGAIINRIQLKIALDENRIDDADKIIEDLKKIGAEHEKSVMFNQAVLYEKKGLWKDALNSFTYYLKQYPEDENALHEVEFITAQLTEVVEETETVLEETEKKS